MVKKTYKNINKKIKDSILQCILNLDSDENCEFDKNEKAIENVCIAIEGTAKKCFEIGGRTNFKKLLRKYYFIIELAIGDIGSITCFNKDNIIKKDIFIAEKNDLILIDLEKTIFNYIDIFYGKDNKKKIENPDLADIVYHVFRCKTLHCESISDNHKIIPAPKNSGFLFLDKEKKEFSFSKNLIWALIFAVVFAEENKDIEYDGECFLDYKNENKGIIKNFLIKDSWGKYRNFEKIFLNKKITKIGIDFKE